MSRIKKSNPVHLVSSMLQNFIAQGTALIAEKEKIAAGGEYNLSGERYRETVALTSGKWALVALQDVCVEILSGGTPSTKNAAYWQGNIPWITSADIVDIHTAIPRKHITEAAVREPTAIAAPLRGRHRRRRPGRNNSPTAQRARQQKVVNWNFAFCPVNYPVTPGPSQHRPDIHVAALGGPPPTRNNKANRTTQFRVAST